MVAPYSLKIFPSEHFTHDVMVDKFFGFLKDKFISRGIYSAHSAILRRIMLNIQMLRATTTTLDRDAWRQYMQLRWRERRIERREGPIAVLKMIAERKISEDDAVRALSAEKSKRKDLQKRKVFLERDKAKLAVEETELTADVVKLSEDEELLDVRRRRLGAAQERLARVAAKLEAEERHIAIDEGVLSLGQLSLQDDIRGSN